MLHLEWVRLALENAIINGEHRLYEGSCAVDIDKNGRWIPHNYKNGVCPISVICLGDYADDQIHTRASEKLGVSSEWLNTFIRAFDGNASYRDSSQEAWELGSYFREKYLFKSAEEWAWNEDEDDENDDYEELEDDYEDEC